MSQLAVTVLQFGLLLLLWIMILSIVAAQGRDLMISKRSRTTRGGSTRGKDARRRRHEAAPAVGPAAGAAAAPPQGQHQPGQPPQGQHQPPRQPAPQQTSDSAAAPHTRPRALVVVEGPAAGTEVELGSAPVMLGRAQESTLVLVDDYASGKHARLFPQGSRWFLEDLGSTNGTWLDEEQLTRAATVEPGERIRIGKTVLELRA